MTTLILLVSLSMGRYLLEVYLAPHSLNSPCASHVLLAIKEHLVCGVNSPCFGRAQKLSLEVNCDCSWTLRMSSPKYHQSLLRKKPIARLVNFHLTSESVQLKPYSLGEAYLKVGLPG
jgi:hypothetical protein